MKQYKSHKIVEAGKITELAQTDKHQPLLVIEGQTEGVVVSHRYIEKFNPKVGGYYVKYPDGYDSFSPPKPFEKGYREVEPINYAKQFDFGLALCALKEGKRVAREGWNGKDMHLEAQMPDENSKMTHPYLFMTIPECEEGVRKLPWQPAQVDMMASDWCILGQATCSDGECSGDYSTQATS